MWRSLAIHYFLFYHELKKNHFLTAYNIRYLSLEDRLQELEGELERINWGILALREVRRKVKEKINTSYNIMMHHKDKISNTSVQKI